MTNKINMEALNTITDKVFSYKPKKQSKQAKKESSLPSSKKETKGATYDRLPD